ncbi:HutD family protein [Caenimonas sp. SL110]|uniref:HutD/Ves family protein n=1 Tax=Caenimonas sp. SL110 TaxID=1450524 RepID=UPI00065299A6|nr:HutD family protein [Caenimonas sp. SL110]
MNWTLIRASDAAVQPWRNGGGVTRELLAWPSGDDWAVRISLADVSRAGPFSSFPGVDRWFAVLTGAGVELTVDGALHRVTRADPALAFSGGAVVDCRLLGGATLDLNLMVKDRVARMDRVNGTWTGRLRAETLVAAFASESDASLDCAGVVTRVPAGTLAWRLLPSETRVQLSGDDAIWMEVAP